MPPYSVSQRTRLLICVIIEAERVPPPHGGLRHSIIYQSHLDINCQQPLSWVFVSAHFPLGSSRYQTHQGRTKSKRVWCNQGSYTSATSWLVQQQVESSTPIRITLAIITSLGTATITAAMPRPRLPTHLSLHRFKSSTSVTSNSASQGTSRNPSPNRMLGDKGDHKGDQKGDHKGMGLVLKAEVLKVRCLCHDRPIGKRQIGQG